VTVAAVLVIGLGLPAFARYRVPSGSSEHDSPRGAAVAEA
jgi:hypothetical protein